jgi:cache domain-containing protein
MTRNLARREFITLVGSMAASWPVVLWAQQPDDRVRALLGRILRLQAEYAADTIDQFIAGIKSELGRTTQLQWRAATVVMWRLDALRLLRELPAIEELSFLDLKGHEKLKVSRFGMDVVGAGTDYSGDPKFTEALAKGVYYGPVYFRPERRTPGPAEVWEPQPHMTLSLAGTLRDWGVSVGEVSLKSIQDLVTRINVGDHGVIYVLDNQGRVITHSDVRLVQQDFSSLAHVQAARTAETVAVQVVRDINGREALATYSRVASLGWPVFVELPIEEANAAAQ